MRAIEEQLRDLGRHLEIEAPAITQAEVRARLDGTTEVDHAVTLDPLETEAAERPDRDPKRPLLLAAAAVAALALAAGLVLIRNGSDDDMVVIDDLEPTLSTVVPAVGDTSSAPLPFAGSDVEPGRYETDLLGVSAAFDVPETLRIFIAKANRLDLADLFTLDTPGPVTTRHLSLMRIPGWNTRDEAADPEFYGPGSISPWDVDAWIAANDVVASNRRATTVAGRAATVLDVRLEPADTNQTYFCFDDEGSCLWAASPSGPINATRRDEILLSTRQVNRFWLITIGEHDPLLIHAGAGDGDEAWLDLVESTTLATLQLGADAPPLSE